MREKTDRTSGKPERRRVVAAVVGLAVSLAMMISVAPALAASWASQKTFGEGELNIPVGVAVNEATGDVYVGNYECAKRGICPHVAVFDLFGALTSPSGFGPKFGSGTAVNPTNEYIFAVSREEVAVFEPNGENVPSAADSVPGSGNSQYGEAVVQIASDAEGNVYVPNAPESKIEVFSGAGGSTPAGGVAHEITGTGTNALKGPEGVAIGPNGNIWVADTGNNRIEEFEPDGTFVTAITEDAEDVQAVALDGAGDAFASIGGSNPHVVEYDPAGKPIVGAEKIGERLLSESGIKTETNPGLHTVNGIAFDRTREYLYVVNGGGNQLLRFADWGLATGLPSHVEGEEATLHGTVEVGAGTTIATCKFEYGTTSTYGSSVPCEPSGPYEAEASVSAKVTGLTPGVEYHYRVSATSEGGTTRVGADQAFGPPGAASGESAEAMFTAADVWATVDPNSEPTRCEVQYADAAEYTVSGYTHATAVPCTDEVGPEGTEDAVEARITGLQKDTTYDYRLVAANGSGAAEGSDQTLSTFGIVPESFAFGAFGQGEEAVTQAGAHPYELTDTFRLNTSTRRFVNGTTDPLAPDANAKDIITELPPGLIGNPDATPRCSPYEVIYKDCSGAAQVGMLRLYTGNPSAGILGSPGYGRLIPHEAPLYDVTPPKGIAAQFKANIAKVADVRIDARVRTGSDYGVTAEVLNSSADEGLVEAKVTLWGVPAAESHDAERWCPGSAEFYENCSEHGSLTPFLTDPTTCTGAREAHMTVNAWQGEEAVVGASASMPPITGCSQVPFTPHIKVTPESAATDTATGLHVTLTVPQQENPNKLAEADLKDAKVVLPAGMTVNPSSANGLAGCPLLTGKEAHAGESGIDLENGEAANCPDASKVGTVKIKTPLLEEELEGGVYVARQNANPFKSLLALYISAEAPERGVVIKLAGKVSPNPITGQLVTTFDENPQLPFETLKLDFFGGERAAIATPPTCGTYTTTTLLEPWSHEPAEGEAEGTPDATPSSEFKINSRCADGFSPSLSAGTANNQAGSYGAFAMTLTRKDGEQRLSTVSMKMPDGLSGMVSKVPLCDEADANAGTCPAASKIGHVITEAGVGSEPITLPEEGKPEDPVYLTGKYDGAPYGLSIVVPAEAGPFNLGKVIVRAKIEVDPHTAQVSVISDPMPTILQGIPLDVKTIHVEVDRPEFMFNPTSCEPMSVSGTIGSAEGASASVSSRFQAAGCRRLKFKPSFKALVHAKHSRQDGAYLHVVVKSHSGEANIKRVHVALPEELPSRNETLKKACTEEQFDKNPAGCPEGSFVGHAIAYTPMLPKPLRGKAIFVSHADRGFPDLEVVLHGDGITEILTGSTFINKKGVTFSTFASVPDVPISRFDLVLPEGPHSALGATRDLCKHPPVMPTTITGQNGAVIHQKTKAMVTGCKPALEVVRHKVKHGKAILVVSSPSAGDLVAKGNGLAPVRKRLRKSGKTRLVLQLNRHDRQLLAKHPHRRLKVVVHLSLQRHHKHSLSAKVALLMR